jgi:ABC-2 type transport system permease protein
MAVIEAPALSEAPARSATALLPPLTLRARLRAYRALLAASYQEALQYRAESAVWFTFEFVQPLVMIGMWLTVYAGRQDVDGYARPDMVLYYLGVMVLATLLVPHPEWWVSELIRTGELSQYLIKPIPVAAWQLASEVAWKLVRVLLVTPVLVLSLLVLGQTVRPPALDWWGYPLFLASCVAGFALCHCLKVTLGCTAFWISKAEGVFSFYWLFEQLYSGRFMPLDLLPAPVAALGTWLPFQYIYYVPLQLFLGRLTGAALWEALGVQLLWLVTSVLLVRVVWRRGLVRYEAMGG